MPATCSRPAASSSPARATSSGPTTPSAAATSGTDQDGPRRELSNRRLPWPWRRARGRYCHGLARPYRGRDFPAHRLPAEHDLCAVHRPGARARLGLRLSCPRARPGLPRDARHQLRAGGARDAHHVHRVPADGVGPLVLGGLRRDPRDRLRARHRAPGHAHPARAAPLGDRGGHHHGRPFHPHRRGRQLDLGRRLQGPALTVRLRLVRRRRRCDSTSVRLDDGNRVRLRGPRLGALPLHEARPRDACCRAAACGRCPRRRPRRLNARDRLGARSRARRGRRADGRALAVLPLAHLHAANPRVRLRRRSPPPDPPREADRTLRAPGGAARMKRQIPALASVLVVAAVLCVLPFILSDYNVSLAARVGIFFVAVLGLNILTGYTGQISIGHGAFMAIGGYTTAVMSRDHHTNLVVTMLMAFAICFLVGLIVGLPALRFSGVYLALVTFALAVSVPFIPLQYSTFLGGVGGVTSSEEVSNLWIYVAAWTCSAISFVLAWLLLRGRLGRAFRAIRDSGISAAYAGVAGSLFVLATNGFANPDEFGVFLSLQLLIGAAIAGLGSLWGILAGAAFVGLLPQVSSSVPVIGHNQGRDVVFGAAVILVMLLLPDGFAGLVARLRRLARA